MIVSELREKNVVSVRIRFSRENSKSDRKGSSCACRQSIVFIIFEGHLRDEGHDRRKTSGRYVRKEEKPMTETGQRLVLVSESSLSTWSSPVSTGNH